MTNWKLAYLLLKLKEITYQNIQLVQDTYPLKQQYK